MKSNVMISEFGKLASEGSPECSMVLHFCSDAWVAVRVLVTMSEQMFEGLRSSLHVSTFPSLLTWPHHPCLRRRDHRHHFLLHGVQLQHRRHHPVHHPLYGRLHLHHHDLLLLWRLHLHRHCVLLLLPAHFVHTLVLHRYLPASPSSSPGTTLNFFRIRLLLFFVFLVDSASSLKDVEVSSDNSDISPPLYPSM